MGWDGDGVWDTLTGVGGQESPWQHVGANAVTQEGWGAVRRVPVTPCHRPRPLSRQGLLEQAGGCVPPSQCDCLHPGAQGDPQTVAAGDTVLLGCKKCVCQNGTLRCSSEGCRGLLPLSPWSEWTPCGPCLPLPAPEPATMGQPGRWWPAGGDTDREWTPMEGTPMEGTPTERLPVEGTPVEGTPTEWVPVEGTLMEGTPTEWMPVEGTPTEWVLVEGTPIEGMPVEETLTEGTPVEGTPVEGTPAGVSALAAVQHRYRTCLDPQTGLPWTGDAAACSAELQQQRLCPEPHLCQDLCLWSPWGPWGPCQDPCGGGYRLRQRWPRHPTGGRQCRGAHSQTESCNTTACPGGTCEERGRVFATPCANGCPRACADLWPHVECLQGRCQPGCRCPPGQLLQDGACVPITECRCALPTTNSSRELRPGQAAELECHNCTCRNGTFACPASACPSYGPWSPWGPCSRSCGGGNTSRHRDCQESAGGAPCGAASTEETAECNTQPCHACPPGERWQDPATPSGCERSCRNISAELPRNCSGPPGPRLRLPPRPLPQQHRPLRAARPLRVLAPGAAPPGGGVPGGGVPGVGGAPLLSPVSPLGQAGSEWREECQICRCLRGQAACDTPCPPLACPEGAVKVREPGGCCPVCREEWPEEPSSMCRLFTELRPIAKGPCAATVEVTYCAGRCPSRTTVTPEEPYLQSLCECCSYRLDPVRPVRLLRLPCPGGPPRPLLLPVIRSCHCSGCRGGDFSRR
ncbi:SCO-spondin-like [Pluvialis apricaria]